MSTNAVVKTLVGPAGPQGASGLQSPASVQTITTTLASLASGVASITIPKICNIISLQTDFPAWVRLYTNATWRAADASRPITTDPTAATGVVLDELTQAGTLTLKQSPVPNFVNDDTPTANVGYLAVTNYDNVSRAITVTITYLPMS